MKRSEAQKEATPRPWNVQPDGRAHVNLVHVETGEGCPAGQGLPVCSIPRKRGVDAVLIVQAVNAYGRLAKIEALVKDIVRARAAQYLLTHDGGNDLGSDLANATNYAGWAKIEKQKWAALDAALAEPQP